MFTRLLILALVCVIAFGFIRKRKREEAAAANKALAGNASSKQQVLEKDSTFGRDDYRLAAYLFLILLVGISAGLYYNRWQDDHSVITITLFRDNNMPTEYQVYKYQLESRSFTTIDGRIITIASDERMEIEGL